MSNSLSIYQRMPNPLEAIQVLGKAIAKSGLFGCANPEQGMVLATECMARGKPPLMLQEEYHFVMGKLSKKAEAMLADLVRLGGKYQIVSRTPDCAAIKIDHEGRSETFSLTWEEAQQEAFVYDGKEREIVALLSAGKKPKLKDKYATPRSRSQMLWARVISDAVRAICPAACQGVYTPEENADAYEMDHGAVINADYTVVEQAEPTESEPVEQAAQPAESTAETETAAEESTSVGDSQSVLINGPCTDTQIITVKNLLSELNQEQPGTLAKFKELLFAAGKSKIAELTIAECESLVVALKAKAMQRFFDSILSPKK